MTPLTGPDESGHDGRNAGLTAAARQAERDAHFPQASDGDTVCNTCWDEWPCQITVLLDALDATEKERDEARETVERLRLIANVNGDSNLRIMQLERALDDNAETYQRMQATGDRLGAELVKARQERDEARRVIDAVRTLHRSNQDGRCDECIEWVWFDGESESGNAGWPCSTTALLPQPDAPAATAETCGRWHVTQTILHDPARPDVQGNCLQALVASMLGVPLDTVPHFVQTATDTGSDWLADLVQWLSSHLVGGVVTSLAPGVYTTAPCGCTTSRGRTITDATRHAQWHANGARP